MLGELGHGGMAVVYRARDTHLLRDVAVKVLHPHLASDAESRQRFLREAQAAARLRHPNIVEVFDFSVETDRDSFMVSELLEGPTLRRFAELNPGMTAEVAAAIGIVLCAALKCAHEQGVIHRDVKPDNILLQTGGILKLTDFGIAHVADGNGMTVTGQVLGSPAHMAPEQIDGRRIDARADIFAAGTVLYSLAVGRLPFEAPNAHALLRKILESDYPDPLRAAPTIGHRFAAIVRRCLERDPDRRYASAEDLALALREFVAETGWSKPEKDLKRYFADPAALVTAQRTQLLEQLPELGVRARKAGRLPDALGYFNRALAIDPANAKVLALVRSISRRRRMRRTLMGAGVIALTAAASAGIVVFGVKQFGHHETTRPTPPSPIVHADPPPEPIHVPDAVVANPPIANNVAPSTDAATSRIADAAVAQAPDAATRAAATGTHTTTRTTPRTTSSSTAQNAAHSTPATSTVREIHLRLGGSQGLQYSIDDGAMVQYGPAASRVFTLRTGTHHFRVVPNDASTCTEVTWSQEITAAPEPLPIERRVRCQ